VYIYASLLRQKQAVKNKQTRKKQAKNKYIVKEINTIYRYSDITHAYSNPALVIITNVGITISNIYTVVQYPTYYHLGIRIFVFSYLYICIALCVVYISVCVSVAPVW